MPASRRNSSLLVKLLIVLSIVGFLLFTLRILLFWLGILPTHGIEVDNRIVLEWILTFILNSFGLFLGRYLQSQERVNIETPVMLRAIVLVLVLILSYQIYSVVFRSWAGLTYNQLTKPKTTTSQSGPFQPR